MVGHVNRNQRAAAVSAPKAAPAAPSPGTNTATAPEAQIHGMAEIRDAEGNLKGTFTFGGTTDLTREELEQKLGLQIPVAPTPGGENNNGSGTDQRGEDRSG